MKASGGIELRRETRNEPTAVILRYRGRVLKIENEFGLRRSFVNMLAAGSAGTRKGNFDLRDRDSEICRNRKKLIFHFFEPAKSYFSPEKLFEKKKFI